MTQREQVEQVLSKHLEDLVADLLALFPAPSREALDAILCEFIHEYRVNKRYSQLVDTLMAWATGQPTRVWCSHISWAQVGKQVGQHWYYRDPVDGVEIRAGSWNRCPICGTVRPEEPR